MLVNGTKNITYDLKINYRIIQSIQFFSSKVLTNLEFIEEYLNEILDVIDISIGHNINFYDIFQLLKRSLKLTVSNAGVRSVDKKGSFDEFLKSVKNKNLSPRLKKLKKSLLIKSPFQKKPIQSKTA